MNWNVMLLLAVGSAISGTDTDSPRTPFADYGQAWRAAAEVKKPMLVVLNPAGEKASTVSLDELKKNEKLNPLLDHYVVAVIDTGTEHGKKVYESFGSPALPRVVVIDEHQKNQLYRTSQAMTGEQWTTMLETYQNGAPRVVPVQAPYKSPFGDCPNCRRFSAGL